MVGVVKFEALHRQAIANPASGVPHRRTARASLIQNNKVVEKYSANLWYSIETQTLYSCPFHPEALIATIAWQHRIARVELLCPVPGCSRAMSNSCPVCFCSDIACWLQLMANISGHRSPEIS